MEPPANLSTEARIFLVSSLGLALFVFGIYAVWYPVPYVTAPLRTAFGIESSSTLPLARAAARTQSAAVHPPKTYVDPGGAFSLSYPSAFSIGAVVPGATYSWMTGATSTGSLLAAVEVPANYQPGTSFLGARFTIGSSNAPQALAGCLLAAPAGLARAPSVSDNGISYVVYRGAGVVSYRTIHEGTCYALEYAIRTDTTAARGAPPPPPFDEARVEAALVGIAQSFAFLK